MKILLIDDDIDILNQAKLYLEKKNKEFNIDTAKLARKGLDKINKNDYDIIISDYQMPKIDGLEFLRIIREEREEDIPFIIFTGKGREEVAIKALNLGANRYIQKGGKAKAQYGVLSDAIKQEYEHYKSKKALQKSEKEKSLILENVDEIIAYHDKEHNLIWANKAYRDATDLSPEDIEGKKCYHAWELKAECSNCPVTESIRKGKPAEAELTPENQEHWPSDFKSWLVKSNPVRDESGDIIGAVEIATDITEKKRTEKELKESRRYYRTIVETSPEAIAITDLEGNIIDCNERDLDMHNIESKKDMLGKNALDFIIPEDRDSAKKNIKKTLEEGKTRDQEYTLIDSENNEFPVEMSAGLIRDAQGEPDSFMAIIKDISERKNAEKELERKEKYLDYIPEFVNVIDKNGDIVYRSKSFLGDNIIESEEIDDSNMFEFVHPDDREKAQEYFFKALENPGEEFRVEIRGKTKDGWTWFEGRFINYLDEDPVNGIIVTGQDISERKEIEDKLKESEKRYRRVTENINDVITLVDEHGKIIYGNEKAHKEVLGYDVEDLINEDGFQFFHQEDRDKVVELFDKCIKEGKDKERVEARFRCKDGSYKWLECLGRFFSEGRALIVSRDITEKREARDREKFLHSILRHDVKNKLQVAKGYLQLIEEGKVDIKEYSEKITKSIDSADDIIKKVRTLQRIEEEEEVIETDLKETIEKVIEEYEEQMSENKINIEYDPVSSKIKAGPLLDTVFSNIIENSIKHSGGDKIRLSEKEDENKCRITIEDNGKGISEKQKRKILERGYKRGDNSGTGLGMFLVKEILRSYDADIHIKDSDMGGARFDISFKKS